MLWFFLQKVLELKIPIRINFGNQLVSEETFLLVLVHVLVAWMLFSNNLS